MENEKIYLLRISDNYPLITTIENIKKFLLDDGSIDYYCRNCQKIKSFLQDSQCNYTLITDDGIGLDGFCSYYVHDYPTNSIEYSIYLDGILESIKDENGKAIDDISKEQKITKGASTYIFKKFHCPSCNNCITMIFLIREDYIEKIYQSYTSVLLNNDEIKKYEKSKLLEKEDREYLVNANKSRSIGLHIGSFIYLRRVFENMLTRIYKNNLKKIKIPNNKDFYSMKTAEKVDCLKEFLPNLISGEHNKGKYSEIFKLISEGVHNFSETECNILYELLENIIMLILNKEIEDKFEKQTIESFNKNYNLIFNKKC